MTTPLWAPNEAVPSWSIPAAAAPGNSSTWCGPWQRGLTETIMVTATTACYIVLLLACLYVPLAYRFWQNVEARGLKLRIAVIILLIIHLFSRIPWNVINLFSGVGEELAAYVSNRISISANFTAFSLVGALWMTVGHRARDGPKMALVTFEKVVVITFSVFNIILAVYTFLTIATGPSSGPGALAYEINIDIIVITQLAIMMFFLCYGIYLAILIRRASNVGYSAKGNAAGPGSNDSKISPAKAIIRLSALYSFCYLLRAFGFLYRPITKCLLPYWVFWLLSYWVPEIISTAHVIWTYWKVEQRAERERKEYRDRMVQGRFNTPNRRPVPSSDSSAQETEDDTGQTEVDPLSPGLWTSSPSWVPGQRSIYRHSVAGDLRRPLLHDANVGSVDAAHEVPSSLVASQMAGSAEVLSSVPDRFRSHSYEPPSVASSASYSEPFQVPESVPGSLVSDENLSVQLDP